VPSTSLPHGPHQAVHGFIGVGWPTSALVRIASHENLSIYI
jgi:hypothetical protein